MASNKKVILTMLLYFIVTISILIFIPLSDNIGAYSFPSSVLALSIITHGKISLPFQSSVSSYWTGTLSIERDYPAPSLILASFYLITNIPPDLMPLLPISGFIIFIFYYIMLTILLGIRGAQSLRGRRPYEVIVLLLVVMYDLFARNASYYVGRATLGVALFIVIVYLFLKTATNDGEGKWTIAALIILIATSFTYYTSILAACIILLLFLFTSMIRLSTFGQRVKRAFFSLAITSLFLTIVQPIVNTILLSPSKFINNLINWILAQLKIEQNEAYYLTVGNISIDLFTRASAIWLDYFLKLIFIIVFVCYFLNELIKKKRLNMREPANALTIITVGASLAELFYTFQAPTVSLRFITMLSILYTPLAITRISKAGVARIVSLIISTLLIVFYIGTFNGILVYGRINYTRHLYGFSEFISGIVASNNDVIGGDSYYTGYLFFKTALSRDYTRFYSQPSVFTHLIYLVFMTLTQLLTALRG
jgi:hypothetical protein